MSNEQNDLLAEIHNLFKPDENDADRCILYEVTNYKHESAPQFFWDQYDDFNELGSDELVNSNKIEKGAKAVAKLAKHIEKRYCCGLIKPFSYLEERKARNKIKRSKDRAAQVESVEPVMLLTNNNSSSSDDDDEET